jgi:hypothetical protein
MKLTAGELGGGGCGGHVDATKATQWVDRNIFIPRGVKAGGYFTSCYNR